MITKSERERRKSDENPSFSFGEPPRPQGLDPYPRRLWNHYCEGLLAQRVLARTDGQLILDLIEARLSKNTGRVDEIAAIFEARTPFAVETPAPETSGTAPAVSPADAPSVAKKYALDVTSELIPAGKFVKLAAQRYLADLDRKDITFNPVSAQHVADYIEQLGLALLPWQVFVLANLFGWKLPDGRRRFRMAFIEIAKKNGKTALGAALALYMADPLGDGEPNAQTYVAATTRFQSSSLAFKAALRLREANEHISSVTHAYKAIIEWDGHNSFEPLAANSDKLNGLNIHFGLLDELADHPNSSLFNVFTSATAGRKQPLIIAITTAGQTREQIAFEQRNRAAQILEGMIPPASADSFFAYIAEMDEDDDPMNELNWPKANPSLGALVSIENIRDLQQQALAIPSSRRDFERFNLNVWPSQISANGWIDFNDLSKMGNGFISVAEQNLSADKRIANAEARLKGRRCIGGLDLAVVSDLSALALVFPPLKADGLHEVLFRVWCPAEHIERRSREQRVPYDRWAAERFIIPTPGETTDYAFIEAEILALRQRFEIKELGFDAALAHDLAGRLRNGGVTVTQVAQGFHLSAAIQRVEKLIIEKKFCMHGHPVANWCFSNVVLDYGVRDVRLEKKKSREKIDCASACIVAMDCVMKTPDPGPDDKYKVRLW